MIASDLTDLPRAARARGVPGHQAPRSLVGGAHARVAPVLLPVPPREGHVDVDPTAKVGTPKQPRSIPKAIPLEDVERLIDAPAPDDLPGTPGPGDPRDPLRGRPADLGARRPRRGRRRPREGSVLVRAGKGRSPGGCPSVGQAVAAIGAYLTGDEARAGQARPAGAVARRGPLFLNARGGRLSTAGMLEDTQSATLAEPGWGRRSRRIR